MSDKVPSHYDPLICGWFPCPPRKSKRWQLHAQETERILTELIAEYFQAGYDLGAQDSMLRATQYERILTDLIAELRKRRAGQAIPLSLMIDRAEARLRELDTPTEDGNERIN